MKNEKINEILDHYNSWQEVTGDTQLIIAVRNDDMLQAEELIKSGADVNEKNNLGAFPLIFASGQGNLEIVKLLIQSGANVNAINKQGFSSLMDAVEGGHYEIAKVLIQNGASTWNRDKDGNTALSLLIQSIRRYKDNNTFNRYMKLLPLLLKIESPCQNVFGMVQSMRKGVMHE